MKRMRQKTLEINERKISDMKILKDPTQIKADKGHELKCIIGVIN